MSLLGKHDGDLPERLGLFPLPQTVLFPGTLLPLHVFEARYRRLVEDALDSGGWLAVPRLKPGFEPHYNGSPPVYEICGAGKIRHHAMLEDGRYNIILEGLHRVRLVSEIAASPYRVAHCEPVEDDGIESDLTATAMKTELLRLIAQLTAEAEGDAEVLIEAVQGADTPGHSANCIASAFVEDAGERQQLLEELDPIARIVRVNRYLRELIAFTNGEGGDSGAN